jgi:hypothetical protein
LNSISLTCADKEFISLRDAPDDKFDQCFVKACDKVIDEIHSCVSKDSKICILAGDLDNLSAAVIIYYLMKQHKMNYTAALSLVKERRISVKLEK